MDRLGSLVAGDFLVAGILRPLKRKIEDGRLDLGFGLWTVWTVDCAVDCGLEETKCAHRRDQPDHPFFLNG